MNWSSLIARLERFPRVLAAVVEGLSPQDAAWKPADGGWCVAEVVGHLLVEETKDFRPRLAATLEDAARPWAPLDPEGDVAAGRFAERALKDLVVEFGKEREWSVRWLRGLEEFAATRAHVHATAGTLRAGDLLASWAAHDARHLQQVAKRLHGLAARDGAPFSVDYAG